MANEGFGALSTFLNAAFAGGATATGTGYTTRGARYLYLYNVFTKVTDNITAYAVQCSDDGGTTWYTAPYIQRNTSGTPVAAPTATGNWRAVVDLGRTRGSNARKVRIVATAAGTAGSTLVVTGRFDGSPTPFWTA